MWLILGLCLTASLIHSVEMLQCLRFVSPACVNQFLMTTTGEVCTVIKADANTSDVNTTCITRTSFPKAYCLEQQMDSSPVIASIGLGFANVAISVFCCSTDKCNNATLPEPNNAPNGLKCISCNNMTDKQCNTEVSCVGVQDLCLDHTAPTGNAGLLIQMFFPFLQRARLKGCVSRNLCGPSSITKFNCISNLGYSAIKNTEFRFLLMIFITAFFL
ncbi:phospholipase A2 inhibitor NAI-like [Labeo rohita]|uniref:phospholipase A2 inhibitor NAI-like n=1 Tax=Labeo rohita TaxID=84645 RepID=UPI0021E27166|nr:phospholipase A2 inhibitor NAI-like [Labeo rohita]